MARENEKEEMKSVTMRIPKELYFEYKKALLEQGKIVTYDVRRYMNEVVENHREGQK
ncbi:transcriptional regulator [Virgibacillus salexigens]|uniref:transcriptional regulator n=1 Tax=Virgibacillus massiliensis TaxID=1462526 RepID=UPI00136BE990|nr:transcriptional regulator [Virgibacillus massiliensis]MYL44006.1 transcriptional regulator [Virgibacillus massiliensis]